MRTLVKALCVSSLILAILVGTVGAFAYVGRNPLISTTNSTGPRACEQTPGVMKVQLGASAPFGEVTTFALPTPLKAPNSIVAAQDGSVWFGEVGLRGVAHLFANGTLLEYAWPASTVTSETNCFDISELWGIALWHGMVWTSDAANNELIGLSPANDTFRTVQLPSGTLPRFLAVDSSGNLWFTSSSTPAIVGVMSSQDAAPRLFSVSAARGEISTSLTFYNSSLAYLGAVDTSTNAGQVFAFDPSTVPPKFVPLGANDSLLGPYSASVADGQLWASEHDSSDVALFNQTTHDWSFYPTSVNPDVALTLPYYTVGNGSSLWFNEQTGNRIGVLTGDSLTEYNISSKSMISHGIENALTIALHGNLLWFTEWTGNAVGFVNASSTPPFSVSYTPPRSGGLTVAPGSSVNATVTISGNTTSKLLLSYSDSETHQAIPQNLTITSNVSSSLAGVSGTSSVLITISAKHSMIPGDYLVLATVSDGMTYRSVYIPLVVT